MVTDSSSSCVQLDLQGPTCFDGKDDVSKQRNVHIAYSIAFKFVDTFCECAHTYIPVTLGTCRVFHSWKQIQQTAVLQILKNHIHGPELL